MTATISRGGFVKLAGAFAGTLALGLVDDRSASAAAAAAENAADGFSPNVWLRIEPDGLVTVSLNKSEMGQGVATGLPTLIAEELDVPLSQVRVAFAPAGPEYIYPGAGRMSTGGSTSMRDSWPILRRAGATARAMLVAAAAKRWGADPAHLETQDGAVIDRAGNRRATYGSLTAAAATLAVPENVELKDPARFRLIGNASVVRTDVPEKVDGSVRYGMDVKVPGMKYAAIARSPVFGGKVKTFDSSKARAVHGVQTVVVVPSGIAVVADNTWAAFQGRDALVVEWDEGPNANLSTEQMFAESEQIARDSSKWQTMLQRGNADAAHGKVVEALYRGPFLAHATMEPMNATADVRDDSCEVWASNQVPTLCQSTAARVTGLPLEKCIIHTTMLGGGFGRRLQSDYVEEAVNVSKQIKAPVKVVWTREDDIQHDWYRPMSVNAMRGVLDGHGNLVALRHVVVAESITRLSRPGTKGPDGAARNGVTDIPYTFPNYTAAYGEYEHGIPVGSWRAPDANWNTFVTEAFIDELAHEAGKDPVAFRLAMLPPESAAAQCLRAAAERGRWGKPRGAGVHQGVAVMVWNGSIGALVADVSMQDGMPKVHHVSAVVHIGTVVNPQIVVAQTQSAINYGLSAALTGKITFKNGRVEQSNFDSFTVLHLKDAPTIDVYALPSHEPPTGIGELGLPGIAPAVAAAVFSATGKRIRTLPFSDALA
ncbi:MAG TPA: molybdopterin cofactor-binding domain-containing protein [Candidatus Limnocylindria bacterium]|jgi:isoquinoline 1-oxidoreductase beta subunit|nr:molybdopterin cofactor-binding domain-containing protein [Candidatus Limnocylindria bacterium]